MTNSKRQLITVNLFCAVVIILAVIFCIKTPSIKPEDINDNSVPNAENSVSYEDYKTFEKVAKKLNIKYEFASKEDKDRLTNKILKEKQNKSAKQLSIILLSTLVCVLITNCISMNRDE